MRRPRTFESPEALASAVLEGLARNDGQGLKALPLSEDEFRQHVWPKLPVSRPERNVPFDYVGNDLSAKSRAYLAANLASQPTRDSSLVKVLFDGETTDYGTFAVLRKARLIVRDPAGQDRAVRVFGSVLRKDGRYKLFSYVTD